MKCIVPLLAGVFCMSDLNANIPFASDVKLGINYSIYFSQYKINDPGKPPYGYYSVDFENLKKCSLLTKNNRPAIKLFNDVSLAAVINNTDYDVFLGIDNTDVGNFANNLQAARDWVAKNANLMVTSKGKEQIQRVKAIHVGNEIFAAAAWDPTIAKNTPQAMRNIIQALKEKNLSHIKVSTTTCCATAANNKINVSLPGYTLPSSYTGGYEPPFIEVKKEFKPIFKEIIKIIHDNNSFLSINLYPPFAMKGLYSQLPPDAFNNVLQIALFQKKDAHTGNYMVEDMIKGYDFAIKKLQIEEKDKDPSFPPYVDYVISEIGWPRHLSSPTDSNAYVSTNISKEFYQGLKNWQMTENYLRKLDPYIDPGQTYSQKIPMFIFEFRDEKLKKNELEPYWGLYTDAIPSVDETGVCSDSNVSTP